METTLAMEPRGIGEFSLFVNNTIRHRGEAFRVMMVPNQTLLEAMQALNYPKFCFETKTVPGGGPYVVEVNGVKGENKRFWETLLHNTQDNEVKPTSLSYQLCPDDNVYLRFTQHEDEA